MLLTFVRPDMLLYMSLGIGGEIDDRLRESGMKEILTAHRIMETHHSQRSGKLLHRALKHFDSEQPPFKRFHHKAAFYYTIHYTMLPAFFLYEVFNEDLCIPIVMVKSYATTLRRKLLDVAGKIVSHPAKSTLKVNMSTWESLGSYQLWMKSQTPIRLRI